MSESVNRNGFPRSGTFLTFLKMFASLDAPQRRNVFISRADEPGTFNYCVFPSAVTLPPDCERFIKTAEAVVEIMTNGNGSTVTKPLR
jgi:hypothetical protein